MTAADSDPVGKEAGKRSAGVRKPLKRRQPMADGAYGRLEQRDGKHDAEYRAENRCHRLDASRRRAFTAHMILGWG